MEPITIGLIVGAAILLFGGKKKAKVTPKPQSCPPGTIWDGDKGACVAVPTPGPTPKPPTTGFVADKAAEKNAAKSAVQSFKVGTLPMSVEVPPGGPTFSKKGSMTDWLANLAFWEVYVPPHPAKISGTGAYFDAQVAAWKRIRKEVVKLLPAYTSFGDGPGEKPPAGGVKVAANCSWATVSHSWWGNTYQPYVVSQAQTEEVTELPVADQPVKISLNAIESWFNNCSTSTPAGGDLQVELEQRARAILGIKG
jgi:hypothetical protein